MANNSTPDVFLLLGVEGGGDIGKGSGALIARQLKQIMHDVEETITSHLKISLDTDSLAELKSQIEKAIVDARAAIKSEPLEFEFSFDQKSIDKAFRDVKQQLKEQHITISAQPQEKKPKQDGSGDIGSTSGSPSLENTKKEVEGVKQEIAGVEKAAEKVADAIESISEAERKAAEEAKKLQAIINKTIELDFPTGGLEREYKTTLGYLSDFISTRRTAKAKQDDYIVSTKDFTKFMNANHADDYGWWAYKYEDPAEQREKVKEWITREYDGYDDLFDFIKNKDGEITGIRIKNQEELQKRIQDQHEIQRKIYDDQEKYNEAIRTAREQLGLSPNDSGWGYDINADQLRQLEQSVPGIQEALQIKAHGDITKTLEEAEKASQELKKIQDTFQAVEETATPALDSVGQGLEDVAAAEEKATKGADDLKYELSTFTESKFLEAPRKAAETANLLKHFPEDVSAFMGSDAQNPSNAEEVPEKARQIREAREAAAKAAAEEAEAIRQSSEASEDEIDDIHRRTDAIEDETDALRENSRAREEIEQELGDARRDGLDYERAVLSHSSTYAPNGVTHSVTTRGADTGSVYTDITKRVIGKDGSEQVLTTLKSTDAQINKTIENLFKKITILREQMGRIPEEYTSEIKTALDSTEQLVAAMSEAAAGEPDKMNGMNFTDIREAEAEAERSLRSINVQLGDAKKKVTEVRKEATSAEKAEARALAKVDETLTRADAKRIQITRELADMTSEYATQFDYAGDQQEGINEHIKSLEQLKLTIEEYIRRLREGEDVSDFWKDKIPGVTNLDSAVKELNKTLALTESELAVLKGDSTAVTDEAARVAVNQYNKAIKDFNSAQGHERFENLTGLSEIDASNLEEVRRNYSAITSATRELTTATSQLNSEYRDEQNNLTQRNKIFQEAKNYYDKYQSGIKANIELNQRWLKLMQQVHDGELNNEEARRALAELQTATKDANAETMTLWGSLKKLFSDHFGSVSATAAIGVFRNILRGAYQNVLEIDKAMTELKKVTDLAESQYVSFQNRAADMAREVGGTIADTISSTADYARLGYSLLDSEALAKAALTYKNVGDGIESIDEATASIISTIKAYNIEAKDAMQVVDLYNLLGNSLPISSGALGTALQKSASALAAANNTLEESAALISAANSVVQNEEVTGTAMKTISMYLRAAKTEAEEAGIETDGMADSVAKLRQELLDLANVDIMLDDDTFKSTYQIIKELSEVWDEISDVSQANILEKIGGKRNANINAALIENFDIAEKALALSQNAAGSALEENEKYLESIEGHINKLKVAYEDLSQTVIDSDLVKIGVDSLTLLTSGAADLIKQFGTLQTIIPIIAGGLSAFKNVGIIHREDISSLFSAIRGGNISEGFGNTISGIKDRLSKNLISSETNSGLKLLISEFQSLGNVENSTTRSIDEIVKDANKLGGVPVGEVFSEWAKQGKYANANIKDLYATMLGQGTKGLSNVADIIKTFNSFGNKQDQLDFANAVGTTDEKLGSFLQNAAGGKASLAGYGASLVGATIKSVALTAATAALNAAISIGISLVISLATWAYSELTNAVENATKKLEESVEAVDSLKSEYESLNKELKDNRDRLVELNNIQSPTLFEQDELDALKAKNDELERAIRLKELEIQLAKQEVEEAAKVAANTETNGSDVAEWIKWITSYATSFILGIPGLIGNAVFADTTYNVPELTNAERALRKYSQTARELEALDTEDNGYTEDYKAIVRSDLEDELKKYQIELTKERNAIEKILLEMDETDPANAEAIKQLRAFVAEYDKVFGYMGEAKTFTEIYNLSKFGDITAQLENLVKEGKLTEETFGDVEGIEEFQDALASIGITEIDEIIRAIIKEVQESGEAAEGAIGPFDAYTERLSKLKEVISSFATERDAIKDIFDKVSAGEVLTDEDVQKLEEYPELLGKVKETADGWTIEVEDLKDAYTGLTNQIRETIVAERDSIAEGIANREKQLRKYQSVPVNNGYEAQQLAEKQKELREEMADGESQITALNAILKTYNSTLKATEQETENSIDAAKRWSGAIETGANAEKEFNESGKISASTLASLVSLSDDYWKAIEIENGVIKINSEIFKNIAKAKLEDELATIRLAEAEALYNRNVDAMYGGKNHDKLQDILDDTTRKRQILEGELSQFDDLWSAVGSDNSDQEQTDFNNYMEPIQRLFDRGLILADEYYSALTYANEQFYKDSEKHAEDYQSNITKIWEHEREAYKQKADDEKKILEDKLELGYITQQQYDNGILDIAERYYGNSAILRSAVLGNINIGGTEWGQDNYKSLTEEAAKNDQSQYKEEFQKQREALDEELKKGFITVEQFQNKLRELRDTWWGKNSDWFGTTFASEMYDSLSKELADVGDLYDEYLDTLKKRNNGTIEAMEAFVDEWRRMNEGLYMRTDPKQYQTNLAEIIDYEKSILDKKYDEGLISAKEYQQALLSLWQDNADILGESTYGEWLTESLNKRAEQEKTYWEQQKELIEEYYDKQIEELQKVQDEQERVNKAEELRLNLIKARQALEDAKKQRNQLLFADGTFRYDVDQDAVLSAEESLADAIKAISENELQEQIQLLQEQKETEANIYDAIISMIDQYISKSTLIKASDTDMLNIIRGSIYGEDWAKRYNGEVQANEVTDEQKAVISPGWSAFLSRIKSNAATALEVAAALIGQSGIVNNNSGSIAQDAISSAMQNTYNNSTITDDHSVNVGDVHVTVQGSTSKEMIDEFAHKLSSAITNIVPKYAPV